MRTSTLILSIATATFAATTGWLAWELHRRDAEEAVVSATLAPSGAPGETSASSSVAIAGKTSNPSPAGYASSGTPPASALAPDSDLLVQAPSAAGKRDVDQDPAVNFARQFLARYDDSAQREVQLDEARSAARRQYSALKEKLGLSNARFEQLVDLVAQQNLKAQELWARCALNANCDPKSPRPMDDRSPELAALLGAGNMDSFNAYRDALMERDAVAQFRGRLSDAQFLPQAQSEQLIAALAEERKLFAQEAGQRGTELTAIITPLGTLWYPADAGSVDVQLAEAAAYSQRMRARAAGVLSPAQLAAFIQMQEELLAQLATMIRPQSVKPDKAATLKLAQS
jgi:hypothetical protein